MSWIFMDEQKSVRLQKQQMEKPLFFWDKEPMRFSDRMWDGTIHPAKLLVFYEEARFRILENYQEYCKGLGDPGEIGNILEKTRFVVTRIVTDHQSKSSPVYKDQKELLIRTRMIIQPVPVMEFHQCAKGQETTTTVSTALIDEKGQMIRKWDEKIYNSMLLFVNEKGSEVL